MRRGTVAVIIMACVVALGWAAGTIRDRVVVNRQTMQGIVEEREGWARYKEQMAHPPIRCSFTIPRECMVAKTDIVSEDAMELSGNVFFSGLHANDFQDCYFRLMWGGFAGINVRLDYEPVTGEYRYWADVGILEPGHDTATWVSGWYAKADVPDFDWDFSIKSTHSRIHRTRTIEPWRGSDIGPTHATENRFSEGWVAEPPYEVTATFGSLSWNTNTLGIAPDVSVATTHQLHWNIADTEFVRLTLDSSSFEYDFTSIEDHCYGQYANAPRGTNPGAGNMRVEGSGNILTFQSGPGGGGGQHPYIVRGSSPPRVLDTRQTGLCGHGDTAPNDDLYGSQLHWLWNGYAVCPVWRYQNGPLWVPGDPTCASPPGTYPMWAGPAWDAVAGEYTPMWNPLDAACPFCGSQLRPGGMLKVPWIGGWPDTSATDWTSAGDFQDSTEAPLTQAQLHNVFSPYAQRLTPYSQWDKKAAYKDDDYEMWRPFGGGAVLLVDRKDGRRGLLPDTLTRPGGVPVIPIHVGGCDSTDCSSSPYFNLDVSFGAVDVDLSGSTGARVSAWESGDFIVTDGEVGTAAAVTFTVPAEGGTLNRGPLIDPYWERNAAMIAARAGGAFAECYFYHQNNTTIPGDWPAGWTDTDCMGGGHAGLDVTWWATHRYVTLLAAPDAGWVGVTLPQLRLTCNTEEITDNLFDSWPMKDVSVDALATSFTATFLGQRNGDTVYYDLVLPGFTRLEHVTKIEVIFADDAAGDWTLSGLRLDPSDAAPGASVQMSTTTMHQCHHAYDWGGINGIIDGRCKLALRASGSGERHVWKRYLEELIPDVDEVYSYNAVTGVTDTSTAYALEKYARLISAVGEGWSAAMPADWTSIYKDTDGTVLTIGYAFDAVEFQAYGGVNCGFSGWLWQGVAGLCYTPHGVLCAQGGIHGLSAQRSVVELVSIERRKAGSDDAWLEHARADSDERGYWQFGNRVELPDFPTSGGDLVHSYSGTTPTYYEYRVGDAIIERLYERQWTVGGIASDLDSYEDYDGSLHIYYIQDGYRVAYRKWEPQFQTYEETLPVPASGGTQSINVSRLPGQACRLFYVQDSTDVIQAKSEDGELSFTVHDTALTGYSRVEAIELPLDARAVLMLYEPTGEQWYCTVGIFDVATNLYAKWKTPVATTLGGPEVRGDLQRQHDGQLAFNFIDGDEKVRVARCTRIKYDATGLWVLES